MRRGCCPERSGCGPPIWLGSRSGPAGASRCSARAEPRCRLDGLCAFSVNEAETNDTVPRGHALIAPCNDHLLLKRSGTRNYFEVRDGPLVPAPSFRRCALPVCRPLRRPERGRRHHDRHGRRRSPRTARYEAGRSLHHFPGLRQLYCIRHAEGGHTAQRLQQRVSSGMHRWRNSETLPFAP